MDMNELTPILWGLRSGEKVAPYIDLHGVEVSATRTDKVCPHDFAVGMTIPGQPIFYPTHVRLFIDLHLKGISNPPDAKELWAVLEEAYQGRDPMKFRNSLQRVEFPLRLDSTETNLYCAQLLMLEQDFNYGPRGCKKSKYDPPRLFTMGFIRWIASGEDQIDRIITAAVRNYPPPRRFASPAAK